MMRHLALTVAALATMLASCAVPFCYDRAAITEGWSGGVGLGAATGQCVSATSPGPFGANYLPDQYFGGCLTTYVSYGLSERFAYIGQVTGGTGSWLTTDWGHEHAWGWGRPILADVRLGAKTRLSSRAAAKVLIGWPSVANLTLLYDLSPQFTVDCWGEALDAGVGLTWSRKVASCATEHLSLAVGVAVTDAPLHFAPTASVGYSIELGADELGSADSDSPSRP